MDGSSPRQIVVVGSLNRDVVLHVDRIPTPGETVLGTHTSLHRGGKGANQAVAAARLGADVAMVGKVGTDIEGTSYLRSLVNEGIDVEGVVTDIDRPTGSATIMLDANAENAIVVIPGANGSLRPFDVARSRDALEAAAVTLVQLEIPVEAVEMAARLCGGFFVLNPAPAQPLPEYVLARADVLIANASEIARLSGSSQTSDVAEVGSQAQSLTGPKVVVVTLGAGGAIVVDGSSTSHVSAPEVDAVDTTGAGDAFCGAFAGALGEGASFEDATRWAVRVGATATMRVGAQTALPDRDTVVAP